MRDKKTIKEEVVKVADYILPKVPAYQPNVWLCDCPKCKKVVVIGDRDRMLKGRDEPVHCPCGASFLIENVIMKW